MLRAPDGDRREGTCAWYADARDHVLYFGQSAFWWAYRSASGDPLAAVSEPEPRRIGRFDLRRERFLPPLELDPSDETGPSEAEPGGVWDVQTHPNGWVYFTTYTGTAGRVDPHSGAVERFALAGTGLAELALGPDGTLLASRYSGGSVVQLAENGQPLLEIPLEVPRGHRIAPKSVAFDPARQAIWVTSDVLPDPVGWTRGRRHPTLVVGLDGSLLLRIEDAEVQAVAFTADGHGYLAVASAGQLELRVLPATAAVPAAVHEAEVVVLDPEYPAPLDFVQQLEIGAGGRVVATRWSGRIHVFEPVKRTGGVGRVTHLSLPRSDPGGLYYASALSGNRLCASYCASVSVVCGAAPRPHRSRR